MMTWKRSGRSGLLWKVRFLRGRSKNWLRIGKYHVGDIYSDHPVYVSPEAAVAGDVYAPSVVVAGLLVGFVAAQELIVEAGGQVWGDIYVRLVRTETGAKLHGWVSTLDEGTVELLRAREVSLDELDVPSGPLLPPSLADLKLSERRRELLEESGPGRLMIWHQLQAEAAAALAARSELERAFDDRVEEVAGARVSEVARLRSEALAATGEVRSLREQMSKLQAERESNALLAQSQQEELATLKEKLRDSEEALAQLTPGLELTDSRLQVLETENRDLRGKLASEVELGSKLRDRVKRLKFALQRSMQQSSELEQSLVHWQELAEVTEVRADRLEQELADSGRRLIEVSESGVASEQVKITGLARELEQTRSLVAEYQGQLAWARAELAAMNARERQLKEMSRRQRDALDRHKLALRRGRALFEVYQQTVGNLQRQLEQHKQRSDELQVQLASVQRELGIAKSEMDRQAQQIRYIVQLAGKRIGQLETLRGQSQQPVSSSPEAGVE